jgi:DNA polymerase-3 subunit beta
MKATVLQNDFNKWLAVVTRIVPSRGQLPVLANVLIESEKEGIALSATNLEIGLRVIVGGKVTETGSITVPAKNFSEFINSLPTGNVELESEGEKLKVVGGSLAATFTGIAAAEFPVISRLENVRDNKKVVRLKRKIIEEIAKEVAFCAATDESRPVLTGVLFNVDGKFLKVTATDGFRLSRKLIELDDEITGIDKGLILPARTIMEMSKILADGKKEGIELGIVGESNQAVLGYENVELASRVLEGNFPDVERIVPKEWKTEVVCEREELLRAVRAVGIFARDSANVVKFVVSSDGLKIEASSAQTGESKVIVEAESEGEDVSIAFNYRYVLDFLASLSHERIRLRVNDSLTAGVFGLDKREDLLHLIMPVRV